MPTPSCSAPPGRRLLAGLVVVVVALLSACSGSTGASSGTKFQGTELPAGAARPSFTLTDTSGRAYDFAAETRGRTTVLFFGYTSCPDICPVQLATLAQALQTQELELPDVTVVMVTVDPERDTPEVLRRYLDRFDRSFVGLSGTKAQVEAAQQAAGVTPAVVELDDEGQPTGIVGHAAQSVGIGADDVQHVAWPSGTRSSVYAHDLAVLGSMDPTFVTP